MQHPSCCCQAIQADLKTSVAEFKELLPTLQQTVEFFNSFFLNPAVGIPMVTTQPPTCTSPMVTSQPPGIPTCYPQVPSFQLPVTQPPTCTSPMVTSQPPGLPTCYPQVPSFQLPVPHGNLQHVPENFNKCMVIFSITYVSVSSSLYQGSSLPLQAPPLRQSMEDVGILPSTSAISTPPTEQLEDESSPPASNGTALSVSFLTELRMKCCSRANFAAHLNRHIFTLLERKTSNCAGKLGKLRLNPDKLQKIQEACFQMYPLSGSETACSAWKACIVSIDEYNRRLNRKIVLS